jgi:DNA repair protein RadD
MKLRDYQTESIAAAYAHIREKQNNPCIVLPTGAGKTPVMAQVCNDFHQYNRRVLILAHRKELIEQTVEKIGIIAPEVPVGIYSAGLKSRDLKAPVTAAGIQSIYKRAGELGAVDLIMVDEAHLIPPDGDGMYRTFIEDAKTVNPNVRVVGLTATPYRMKSGFLCGPENILNEVCYEIGVRELIVRGFLSKLISKSTRNKVDTSGLHIRAGEFIAGEVEALMDVHELVAASVDEIIEYMVERTSCLIFASGVHHGITIQAELHDRGETVAAVFGDTPADERAKAIDDFKNRRVKYLVNMDVLTTGFDATNVDCVALMRPTASPGLYYQMVGRGFRLDPGKDDCLVLDFGGNIMRHGPVDDIQIKDKKNESGGGIAPAKECPECMELVHAARTVCPGCGYEFPPPERNLHNSKASKASILSGEPEAHEVSGVSYHRHMKKGTAWEAKNPQRVPEAPPTMRVEYKISMMHFEREWVCFEHTGYARQKAEAWWYEMGGQAPVPDTVDDAIVRARKELRTPTKIHTRPQKGNPKYTEVFLREFGEELEPQPVPAKPSWVPAKSKRQEIIDHFAKFHEKGGW